MDGFKIINKEFDLNSLIMQEEIDFYNVNHLSEDGALEVKAFPIKGKYCDMHINILGKSYMEIRGSINKFINFLKLGELNNYIPTTYNDLKKYLPVLIKKFEFTTESANWSNLELSIMIELDMKPARFIEDYIILYKNKVPTSCDQKIGYCIKWEFSEYTVKIYDASSWNKDSTGNILKIEYVSKKKRTIFGRDNNKPTILSILQEGFMKRLYYNFFVPLIENNLVLIDSDVDITNWSESDKLRLKDYTNSSFYKNCPRRALEAKRFIKRKELNKTGTQLMIDIRKAVDQYFGE